MDAAVIDVERLGEQVRAVGIELEALTDRLASLEDPLAG